MYKYFILLFLPFFGMAQDNASISGYIRDKDTGEELIGVNVFIKELNLGVATNVYGYYSLSVPKEKHIISFQYIGYENLDMEINVVEDRRLDIEIAPSSVTLDEVEVTSEKLDKNVTSVEMSVTKLDVKTISKVPQLLGETDVIRTLTLLPGVTTVGEGSSGFNVRGGNVDQNLILLDEAPVYNSSHLFGFFSIFNADAIKDVKLYKGGIPANYGGRLSSVVDVRQIEGNSKKFGAKGGIGLLSSRLLLEGPIGSEDVSFMVAGRRSYADLFLALSSDPEINQNILYFYDLNTKINWRIGKKDRLFLSGYFGKDVFGIADLFSFDWGNTTGSLRWNHLFSDKLFSNFTLIYSDYNYSIGTPDGAEEANSFTFKSRIRDYHFKTSFNYFLNSNNKIDFGMESIYYVFNPGKIEFAQTIELDQEYALEPSLYFSHDIKVNQRLNVQYGLRYSSFYKLGSSTVFEYANPDLPQKDEIVDTTKYGPNEIVASFDGLQGLEPRLSVNYLLDDEKSIKASFNRTRQYIHLISNTSSATPIDLYRAAGSYIDPATVYQYAVGYFQNFNRNMWEASVEVYYKDFNDLVDYRAGADLIFNQTIETELLTGIGRSYGAEFFLRKNIGKLTGWFSYTLSRTEMKVNGPDSRTSISNGQWYSANFDKLHDFSLIMNYQLTEEWDIGGNFIYQTGRPTTAPSGKYYFEGVAVPIYLDRNNKRIPNYHRLDLAANYIPKRDPNKKFYSSWSMGIYNVYGRRNAYSVFFQADQETPAVAGQAVITQANRLSIFAIPIPFVTWNFNF